MKMKSKEMRLLFNDEDLKHTPPHTDSNAKYWQNTDTKLL